MTTYTATMLTVSERLHVARERADVKVGDMAERLGRHRNRVTAYENMGNNVPLWVVRAYAQHLDNGTTVEWLTAEVGPSPRSVIDGYCAGVSQDESGQLALFSAGSGEVRGEGVIDLRPQRDGSNPLVVTPIAA